MQGWLAMAVAILAAMALASTTNRLTVAGDSPSERYGSISPAEPLPADLKPTIVDDGGAGNSEPGEQAGVAPNEADGELQAQTVTELRADRSGHYVAKAEINGTTIDVMVDTGASAVALSYEDADDAGLRPHSLDYDVPVATANGIMLAARVTLRRVEVEGVVVRDVDGLVLPEGAMRGTLLGMSFLSRLSGFRVEEGMLTLEQ